MIKLEIKSTIFIAICLAVILYLFFPKQILLIIIIPIIFLFGTVAYGSAIISSRFFIPTIFLSGNKKNKAISLTFDDGPNSEITPKIIELLNDYNVKATFFCIGKNIEKHPTVFKSLIENNHEIGNHSYSHGPLIDFYSYSKWMDECSKTDAICKAIGNVQPKLFRPPYGVTNPAIAKMCATKKYNVIGWSLRSLDTVIKNPQKLKTRIIRKLKNGDIILFHDTQNHLLPALKETLEHCLRNRIEIVPLKELLAIEIYQ